LDAQGTPRPAADAPPPAPPTSAPAVNLLRNGAFTANWTDGWTRKPGEKINGQSITEVVDAPESASGRAVRLVHDGASILGISQFVDLESPDVRFSGRVQAQAETPCKGILMHCTGHAGIILELFGGDGPAGEPLAMVFFYYAGTDPDLRPASSATIRHIELRPTWEEISFHLRRDVENSLPAVDPSAIGGVRVSLFAGSSANCDPGSCLAELLASDLVLAPEP
ncbi:MAG TPA: hypothetical protein VGE07_04015, partial [Herpetosiphonaceae bacterium]